MTDTTSPAVQVALAYYHAWSKKDIDKAMSYIAQDIVAESPTGRFEGCEAYRAFVARFVQNLVSSDMIAAFGNDETALVMYDNETVLLKSSPAAEHITVQHGKITNSRFIFDARPRATLAAHPQRRAQRSNSPLSFRRGKRLNERST